MDSDNRWSMSFSTSFKRLVSLSAFLLIFVGVMVAEVKAQCPEGCSLPAESGLCYAAFRRYHYNITENRCNEFIYGGCGGNANNFRTMEECIRYGAKCKETCPPSMKD